MKKNTSGSVIIIIILGVLIFSIGGYVTLKGYSSKNSSETDISSTEFLVSPSPGQKTITTDIPPLWPGVEWGEPSKDLYFFTTTENNQINIAGYHNEATVSKDDIDKFTKHYKDYFNKNNWYLVDSADGPNISLVEYYKNSKHFTFGNKTTKNGETVIFIEYN